MWANIEGKLHIGNIKIQMTQTQNNSSGIAGPKILPLEVAYDLHIEMRVT